MSIGFQSIPGFQRKRKGDSLLDDELEKTFGMLDMDGKTAGVKRMKLAENILEHYPRKFWIVNGLWISFYGCMYIVTA